MSILNGMNSENLEKYRSQGIDLFYLEKTNHSGFEEIAKSYKEEGAYFLPEISNSIIDVLCCDGYINARRLTYLISYKKACESLFDQISKKTGMIKDKKFLFLVLKNLCIRPFMSVRDLKNQEILFELIQL